MQQINLLNDLPLPIKPRLHFTLLLKLSLAFILLLMVVYTVESTGQSDTRQRLATLQKKHATLQSTLLTTTAKLGKLLDPVKLNASIDELNETVQRHEAIAARLGGMHSNHQGFSKFLNDLAQTHVQGLWLTHIQFNQGGSNITLNGYATSSALVERYASKILKQPIFDQKHLRQFQVKKASDHKHLVQFTLGTERGDLR